MSYPPGPSSQPSSASYTHPLANLGHHPAPPHASYSQPSSVGGSASHPSPAGGSAGKKVRAREEEEDEEEGRKKRNRQALSCGECKRRKIKCDRNVPCAGCIRRGTPQGCSWDDAKIDPTPQPFALLTDLKRLATRLVLVEEFLQSLPPALRAHAPLPGPLEVDSIASLRRKRDASSEGLDEGPHDSDTEAAAVGLEAVAWGTQANVSVDGSTRFFDTILSRPNVQMEQTQELTSAGTCIVAAPLGEQGGLARAVQMGLDIRVVDVPAARRAEMEAILAALPDRETSYLLVAKYFESIDWLFQVLHRVSFDAEHDKYWEMVIVGRQHDVDPVWLALYSMVVALSLDGLKSRPKHMHDSIYIGDDARASLWYAGSQRLLQLGDYLGKPQIRTVLTIVLYGQWIQTSSTSGQAGRFLIWLSTAIRTAQILGLHQLGDNPETMPLDDPAFPPGKNSVKRESALRIFGVVCFQDWMSATNHFKTYMLHPSQINTAPLSNLNPWELSPTEWRTNPAPRSVLTEASFEFLKFSLGEQSRIVFDKLVSESATFNYSTVLELDRGYRRQLDQLPDLYKQDPPKGEIEPPQQRWRRNVCQEAIHSRILRLHRPFMTRGYNPDSKFCYSAEQCVRSAKIVITSHIKVLEITSDVYFIYNHALGATLVLFADLFHAIDSDLPDAEIEAKRETLVMAFTIFARSGDIASPALRTVVETGSRILSGLFLAEEKRRVARAARTLVGAHSQREAAESFAEVLKRLSRELDIKAPNAASASTLAQLDPTPNFDTNLPQPATPAPYFPPEQDQLPLQFYTDLGLGLPNESSTFDFWTGGTGPSPPDFAFLGATVDWSAVGASPDATEAVGAASSMAANALLEQLAVGW